MKEENEMTEVNVYIAKIYAITKPEKAKEIVENAKKKSKTSGLSYKEVLSEEFINLLDSPEKEDNKKIMEMNFNGKIEDISMMLLSAERYALGRMTYIVEITVNYIMQQIEDDKLSDRCLGQIRDDIKEAKYLGMQCDEVQWIKLLKKIEEVI